MIAASIPNIAVNMRRNSFLLLAICFAAASAWCASGEDQPKELIYVDPAGVMRWRTSDVEVAMLGANYCLPSASDYRAAGVAGSDRKKMIDDDMTHFARMGWDALRLSFWGDWECCDRDGNLIENDHLDLLDYLIFRAKQRDLHMLFSPIVTYSSSWPGPDDPSAVGFSRYFKKEELGTNPKAIAAQANYLKQILNHVNPYTKLALKDEPYLCFVELINEPAQHPQDFDGSVSYINALNDAVRETGCQKITFFNLSQDFAMAQAIAASKADGASFAWYPSGLVAGHQLRGNFLRTVDDYSPMLVPELSARPKVVYEYDMPDVMSGYHYPAMVRTFRSVGAQFAAMFSYDMLATAPYNLGWQTHCLNMVYTPQKAASAIIASQVMRRIPRMQPVGPYPQNTRFGDFRVSYEENLSELVSSDLFYYSNNTRSRPPDPARLRRIVGFGSSHVVRYEGSGIYFLDKISDGVWRLEVYPDALQIDDPFAPTRIDRLVFQLISRAWPMTVDVPDLGASFSVEALNNGNSLSARADQCSFAVRPGVYLLRGPSAGLAKIPDRLPGVPYYLGMREFVCPEDSRSPTCVILHAQSEYSADSTVSISATVAAAEAPESVVLQFLGAAAGSPPLTMHHLSGYDFAASLPAGDLPPGDVHFTISVSGKGKTLVFPLDSPVSATRADSYQVRVVAADSPVVIFDPARDVPNLSVSRSGESRNRIAKVVEGSQPGSWAYPLSSPSERLADDFTASLFIGDRLSDRGPRIAEAKTVRVRLKGLVAPSVIRLTLVEKDGSAWSEKVFASRDWKEVTIPIGDFRSSKSAMLPQGYPGTWSYWLSPPTGRNSISLAQVERLQLSLRKADFGTIASVDGSQAAVAIESVALQY
jgi:hypothetical protein